MRSAYNSVFACLVPFIARLLTLERLEATRGLQPVLADCNRNSFTNPAFIMLHRFLRTIETGFGPHVGQCCRQNSTLNLYLFVVCGVFIENITIAT